MTAGEASSLNDGAAALLVASETAIKRGPFRPLARALGFSPAGVRPRLMGLGPVPAVQKLLARFELAVADVSVIELNEAFAPHSLARLRSLGIADDAEHVHPNGGAIALGHPPGTSGARLAGFAVQELHDCQGRFGLATMCVGVGQGAALLVERCLAVRTLL